MGTKFFSLLLSALLLILTPQGLVASEKSLEITAPQEGTVVQSQNTYYADFGYWPVGSTSARDFLFTNYGHRIAIYSIYTYGGAFYSIDNCPYYLSRGYRCRIRVYFTPWYRGNFSGDTVINTSNGPTILWLTGYGY